jgi:PAS domain S-box-containing protein
MAGVLLVVAIASLVAFDVAPESLLPRYRSSLMAAPTAVAFIAIGVALLGLIARSPWYEAVYVRREDEKILILTTAIFVLVFISLAAAAFAAMQRQLQGTLQGALTQAVADRSAILENILGNRVTRASIVATRPALQQLLAQWEGEGDEPLRERLHGEAVSYLTAGFRGLAFLDEHGRPIAQAGVLEEQPSVAVPIRGQRAEVTLLWNEAFVLRVHAPVFHGATWVGTAVSEQELDLLARLQFEVDELGDTAEWLLCSAQGAQQTCFPQRFERAPRVLARSPEGALLPMDHALAGRRGVGNASDYRGERVIASYGPVGSSGLGIVLKLGIEEFYAPLRDQLGQWARWFVAMALLAALLISSQVRPVAQRLVHSENLARNRADALARSERALREIYAALGDGILVLSADGTIEFLNPAAERIFGYPPGDLVGRNVSVLMPERLRDANAASTRRFVEEGTSNVVGLRGLVHPALRRDGTSFDLEYSLAPMSTSGEQRLVAVLRDVSERTALERLKGEFIATVSHELRTPLTSLVGSLEILRESELPVMERGFLDMASRNAERLATLVDDVIDSERIESGALKFEPARFGLAAFLREAVQLNQSYASAHQVFFYLEEPVPEATLEADRGRVMQVMANLLSNAAKFSRAGEEVRVRATLRGSRVRVAVADRGQGIPEEFKPRVFQKFAQADASDSREKGGTGLGLAICKAIVERSGGTIGYESRPGEGTTFWFELPESEP